MSNHDTSRTIPFAGFRRLFGKDSDQLFCLVEHEGAGSMRKLRIEEGVTACIWNFSLGQDVTIRTDHPVSDKDYCIAFFADNSPLTLCDGDRMSDRNASWDIIFNRSSEFCIVLTRDTRYRCLTIHFSESWLKQNVACMRRYSNKLNAGESGTAQTSGIDLMTAEEKEIVSQLVDKSTGCVPTALFAKAAVLKMIRDFLERIADMRSAPVFGGKNVMHEIEKILSRNLAMMEPDVKELAKKFSISQSTLNRRFKTHYGQTIPVHFFNKRMELARVLIEEKGLSVPETAFILGYKSDRNFVKAYEKHAAVNKENLC